MSKILLLVFILILQITLFPKSVGASAACTSSSVAMTYKNPNYGSMINDKTFFPENSGDLVFEFTINDNNTFNLLNQIKVRLHLPGGIFGSDDKDTPSIDVTNKTFQLVADKNWSQADNGNHEGSFRYQPDPSNPSNWQELCSQIKYTVGSSDSRCRLFNIPAEVQPNSPIHFSFLGRANRKYQLMVGAGNRVGDRTTGPNGMGIFENIIIPGVVGDTVRLALSTDDIGQYQRCTQDIKISATAGPAPTINPNAPLGIPTPGPAATACTDPDKCTKGGGLTCDVGRGPAIQTAIGCIHTNPAEFVKDLLTFLIGFSGGLAFLMMLLGAFQMLTSAGNPETLNAGKSRLTSAAIGLLFVIFSVLFLKIIGVDILNIPGFKESL